jgi:hypothetical protein
LATGKQVFDDVKNSGQITAPAEIARADDAGRPVM